VKKFTGLTDIVKSTEEGQLNDVIYHIETGANPNQRDIKNEKTLLYIATERGGDKIVEYLVEKGANIHAKNQKTLLHIATERGDFKIVEYLVEKGADINAKSESQTSFQIALKRLSGADIKVMSDKPVLYIASERGDYKMVKYLIEKGAEINAKSENHTPLHIVYKKEHWDIFHLLTVNGAVFEPKSRKTLLYFATEINDYQLVKYLIENGAEINAKSENQTPLHIAYNKKNLEIFHLLVLNGAVFEPKSRKTLLYIATEINDYQLVKYLIEKGAEINSKSENQTSLHIAHKKEHLEIFHFLILKGTDLEAKDEKNQTVLQQATEARQFKIINLLLYNGALGKELFLEKYYFDSAYTDLHFASENGHVQNVKFLIEKGKCINSKDKNKKTPLHLASANGHLEIVKNLLQYGASIVAKDKTGNTLLLSASENGHFDVFKFLAENGADLKDKNNYSQGPLHLVSCSDN
jgi:ankyrin repeat protein